MKEGYIALSSMLIVGALIVVLGVSISLTSIGNLLNAYSYGQSSTDLLIVEACAEDALLRLNENGSIPATIILPEGSCSITINSQVGTTWTFSVSKTGDNTKSVQTTAVRGSTISISSWLEQ